MLSQKQFNEHLIDLKNQKQKNESLKLLREVRGDKYYRFKCKECIGFDRSHNRCDIDDSTVEPDRVTCRLFYYYE